MARVTVIIATYNWSTVLPWSIASVLGQTFSDFELLVVGDGCTDDSELVVSRIADPRVRWISLPARCGHQSGPNNEGIRQARGDVIAYLGHDDLWLPHHLEVAVGALDADGDAVRTIYASVRADGRVGPGSGAPSAFAHRRSVVDRAGGWPDYRKIAALPEEDFQARIAAAGFKTTFVKRCTAVKPHASWRRDVYRERPSHEQRAWLERIRSEPDLETTLLADMAFGAVAHPPLWVRIPRLILRPWVWPDAVMRRLHIKGHAIRRMQRFKGVR